MDLTKRIMNLIYLNETDTKVDKKIFEFVLERLDSQPKKAVELLLTNNEKIQELNQKYRSKNQPTDVLSFSLDDDESLGQIVISVDKATEQAKVLSQALEEELQFLFAHGLLHLLGYDHQTPAEEAAMLAKTYQLIDRA